MIVYNKLIFKDNERKSSILKLIERGNVGCDFPISTYMKTNLESDPKGITEWSTL